MSASSPQNSTGEPGAEGQDALSDDLSGQRSPKSGGVQNSPTTQSDSPSPDNSSEKNAVDLPSQDKLPRVEARPESDDTPLKDNKIHREELKLPLGAVSTGIPSKSKTQKQNNVGGPSKSKPKEETPPRGPPSSKKRQPRDVEKSDGTKPPQTKSQPEESPKFSSDTIVPTLPLPPPAESDRALGKPITPRKTAEQAQFLEWRGPYEGFTGVSVVPGDTSTREEWQIGGGCKANLPQVDFLSRPCKTRSGRDSSVSTAPSSGAGTPERPPPTWMRRDDVETPDWQEVLCSLTENVEDDEAQGTLAEIKKSASKEGHVLAARMQKERTSKEVKCRRAHPFKASPKLLALWKIEKTLALKKEFEQATVVQKQAAKLEEAEREKHRTELGERLSVIDQTLVEREEAAASALNRRLLERLWEMGMSSRLPLQELQKACVKG